MHDKTQRPSFENLNGRLGLCHGKERNDKEGCITNDDLLDLMNFWTFCLFIDPVLRDEGVLLAILTAKNSHRYIKNKVPNRLLLVHNV